MPNKGDRYRHFKGKIVTIVGVAKDSEDLSEKVVYEHDGELWVRPLEMFLSRVDHEKYPDVAQEYRFEKIDEDAV